MALPVASLHFRELDRLVGGALPVEYVGFIRIADVGYPEVSCFPVPGGDPENIVEADWFYSVASPELECIKSALEGFGELLGSDALTIGGDGGGNQFYLSLSSEPPSVCGYAFRMKAESKFGSRIASRSLSLGRYLVRTLFEE